MSWVLGEAQGSHGAGLPQLMPPTFLVRVRCLSAAGHPSGAHGSDGMIVLDVLHVLQCPAGPGHSGRRHKSCVRLSSGISQPHKGIARVFLPHVLFRVFETLSETKLVEINAFVFHNNGAIRTHGMVLGTEQVLAKLTVRLSKLFCYLNNVRCAISFCSQSSL